MGDRIGEIFRLLTAPEFSGFPAYRQTVDEITREFTRISQSVRSIEATLHEEKRHELAKLVRCLQDEEKKKLELVKICCLSVHMSVRILTVMCAL
jgi:hypothetical protein